MLLFHLLRQWNSQIEKMIESSDKAWLDVFKSQKEFSEEIAREAPLGGVVKEHAEEMLGSITQTEKELRLKGDIALPQAALQQRVAMYHSEIASIAADYKDVETSFTEMQRYTKKVETLTEKNKKQERVKRNMEKLESAQAIHNSKLSGIVERMRNCFEKHEAILQCAQHSFWLAQNRSGELINGRTAEIRSESLAMKDKLSALNVSAKSVKAIPRSSAAAGTTTD